MLQKRHAKWKAKSSSKKSFSAISVFMSTSIYVLNRITHAFQKFLTKFTACGLPKTSKQNRHKKMAKQTAITTSFQVQTGLVTNWSAKKNGRIANGPDCLLCNLGPLPSLDFKLSNETSSKRREFS